MIKRPFQIGAVFFMSGLLFVRYLLLVMTIAEAYRRFQRLDLRGQVPAIIEMTAAQIIALNHEQLYKQGVTSLGNPVGEYNWEEYRQMKIDMNPSLGGMVDLYLTGDFYSGFFVRTEEGAIVIGSDDDKSDKLESKYGVYIFGLTEESKSRYIKETLFTEIKNYIEMITGVTLK